MKLLKGLGEIRNAYIWCKPPTITVETENAWKNADHRESVHGWAAWAVTEV
jgi:hypothetical protein